MKRLRWCLLALAAIACGCGGGGSVFNDTPAIIGLFPANATAGSQPITVLIGGTGFQEKSTAQWNGVNRPAVFNDSTGQIAMTLLASDLSNPGTNQVTVTNPAPGGGVSPTAFPFLVNPAAVGGPVINSISPPSATATSTSSLAITVTGNNLVASDVITFNGTQLPTAASGSQLTTTLAAEDLVFVAAASIAVQTNTPGIASPSIKFPIGPATNPVPALGVVIPSTTKIGALPPGSFLTLTGSGFVPGSVANFNGSPRPTGYASATVIAVQVLPSDVATGGTLGVTVTNPNPGGGASAAVNFSVQ